SPPDTEAARTRIEHANATLAVAARSPAADQARVAALREQIGVLDDRASGVVVDLAKTTGPDGQAVAPGAKPTALIGNVNGLYAVDDADHVWRAEGNNVADVTPSDPVWKSVDAFAVFLSNLYVLDATSGQVWKHESPDGAHFDRPPQGYLAELLPAGAGRSLA